MTTFEGTTELNYEDSMKVECRKLISKILILKLSQFDGKWDSYEETKDLAKYCNIAIGTIDNPPPYNGSWLQIFLILQDELDALEKEMKADIDTLESCGP